MTNLHKRLLVAGGILAVTAIGLLAILWSAKSEVRREHTVREAALRPLLQSHATREQVAQVLNLEFFDYSVGSTNHWVIERQVSDPAVRQRADRYPGVLFSTTMNLMTWLFFDSQGRLQDYYLCPQ